MTELIVTCAIAGVIFIGCVGYIGYALATLTSPKKEEAPLEIDLDTLIIDLDDKS
ncbi:MAG: hypothetical protein J6R37_03160 [Clostridia bacterium]|nr:hypothetical protein [Clostridia bacterium]